MKFLASSINIGRIVQKYQKPSSSSYHGKLDPDIKTPSTLKYLPGYIL